METQASADAKTPTENNDRNFLNTVIINLTNYSGATTVSPENGTTIEDFYYDYDDLDPDARSFMNWLFIILSCVVFLAGLIGNCLVWFAVWRNPRMRSATNIFLVNLAVADFLVILVCLPPTVAEDITGFWFLGKEMCKIIKSLQRISVYVSVWTLTAISMERWMAICRPLFFRPTSIVALRTIGIIWLISLISCIPEAIFLDLERVSDTGFTCRPSWTEAAEAIHLWIVFAAFYVIPLGIMTFTYIKIALCLWKSGLPDDNDEASPSVPRAQLLLRRKKAKMLIMVVAMFALCFLPVHVLFILILQAKTLRQMSQIVVYAELMRHMSNTLMKPLLLTSHWLVYFSSAVNPMIYNFMSCNFRREFLIACHICCRRGSNHNSAYEAVRMRKFHKFQNRREQRACERSAVANDNSLTLQTQSSVLGLMASSSYSLGPQTQRSVSNVNLCVPGMGTDNKNVSPNGSRRSSTSENRNGVRNISQKNHLTHA